MNDELRTKILKELEKVEDPELGADIVNLGLIYDLKLDEGQNLLTIDMTLTTPGCPLHDYFRENIEEAVMNVPEIDDVEINFVFDPPWDISKISDIAKRQLGIMV